MTTASNAGGDDSQQLGGRRWKSAPRIPRSARMIGKPPLTGGASFAELPDERRARLRRITGR